MRLVSSTGTDTGSGSDLHIDPFSIAERRRKWQIKKN